MNTPRLMCAILATICTIIFIAMQIQQNVMESFTWKRDYASSWTLADKSSSIPAKQKYIVDFAAKLKAGQERGHFAANDAVFLKTPDNSFDANLTAVNTLAQRLSEIQNMNPSSFEYNTAIQQITAQEQGEAGAMLYVLEGSYCLASYPLAWGWYSGVAFAFSVILVFATVCLFMWASCYEQPRRGNNNWRR